MIDVYSHVVASLCIKAVGSWLVEEQSLWAPFSSFSCALKPLPSSTLTHARTTTRIALVVARLPNPSRHRSDLLGTVLEDLLATSLLFV